MANNGAITVWVGTKKGAFALSSADSRSGEFKIGEPQFLGGEIFHIVQDPRKPEQLVMAARTGHLGPTIYHSADAGKTWNEATRPPQFPKAAEGEKGPAVGRTFWLQPGHASQSGTWWAGVDFTIRDPNQPWFFAGPSNQVTLFRSQDGGASWDEAPGLRTYFATLDPERTGFAPGGSMLHSIQVDPRDARHMYISMSTAGTFESLDEGSTWKPLNKGVEATFFPEEAPPEYGQDPHCMTIHPANPDRLYQQNHCGIYRLDRPGETWERIGKNMPADVGDIGFPIVPHPRNADTVWVFPMDGGGVWPRTSPAGKPSVFRTADAGKSWQRQDQGLPRDNAYWTVLRQGMTADWHDPVGLYFGTTSGEVWMSDSEGAAWRQLASHLPYIMSVTVARG